MILIDMYNLSLLPSLIQVGRLSVNCINGLHVPVNKSLKINSGKAKIDLLDNFCEWMSKCNDNTTGLWRWLLKKMYSLLLIYNAEKIRNYLCVHYVSSILYKSQPTMVLYSTVLLHSQFLERKNSMVVYFYLLSDSVLLFGLINIKTNF